MSITDREARERRVVPGADGGEALRVRLARQEEVIARLREEKAWLETELNAHVDLYESAPVAYFSITADGRIQKCNALGAGMLGEAVEKLTGRRFGEFLACGDDKAFQDFLDGVFEGTGGRVLRVPLAGRSQGAGTVRLSAGLAPNGMVCRIVAVDVTERQRLEDSLKQSEAKFRSIVESSPMAMHLYLLHTDGSLRLLDANPAADRMLGIEHRKLFGMDLAEAFPGLAETALPGLYREVARGEVGPQAFVTPYEDGRFRGYYEVHVFRTSPGMIVVAFTDVSERKRAEDALQAAREDLEARVRERTADLERKSRQLQALAAELAMAEERERRRVALMIHDHLQQLLVGALLHLERGRARADGAAGGLERVEGLIRESLDAARSLTAEISPPVLYQCGLAAALKWLAPWCREKYGLRVEVEVDESAEVGEEVAVVMFRAVRELLFNVAKHSGEKHAWLKMVITPLGMVEVEVRDGGVGFEPDGTAAGNGLTGGFGLFNIRERLTGLGGVMELASAPGDGCRAILRAPLHAVTAGASADGRAVSSMVAPGRNSGGGPSEAGAGRRIRLLVADDHAVVRDGLVHAFMQEPDFEVVGQAVDGAEAVELARRHQPDFILMDVNMPGLDGIRATAAITGEMPGVKVLGLSMFADDAYKAAIEKAGAVGLVGKSIPFASLAGVVRGFMAVVLAGA